MRIIIILCVFAFLASCQNSVQQELVTDSNSIQNESEVASTVASEIDSLKEELKNTKEELIKNKKEVSDKNEVSLGNHPEPEEIQVADHYICYTNDNKKGMRIWISFNSDGKAIQVKYKGQKEAINILYDREESTSGGAHPTITTYYQEVINGKVNGKYILTHSGAWDYAEYVRGSDGKKFKFTFDSEANPYGKQPCF